MVRDGVSMERSWEYYIMLLVIIGFIAGIFFWPLGRSPEISMKDIPTITIFAVIMLFTLLGCGLPARDRPHFQSHYHGGELSVMRELEDEIMD
ncbi:MAG: hypothetical protein AM325_009720 [Candidatus Thorarchaeota archaeon SMTZ1-45]|nr:MAG: hypothetical protein AM325_11300 [Candidatus Thorarchaeota archaeon SMTZ1-45]